MTALRPEDFLGYRLVLKSAQMSRRFADELAAVGLRVTEFSTLAVLAARPGATAAELAEAVLISAQSMGPLLDRLQKIRAVVRPERRGKGRVAPAELTDEGRRLLAVAYARVEAIEDEYRRQLGEDYEVFHRIVDRWQP
ncbi:MarR family transcriptional regulator [Microbacterium sp. CCNWLW134]|uniref:MarR family winged helix-turn-helix transcriptional regulator n=1 Tax=Microbacterium sp. CCNWLW134 TaxID=3122064 RepID=UPI00300FBD6E